MRDLLYPWPKITELPCRVCRGSDGIERHHLIPRATKLNRDHLTVPLCRLFHDAIHGERGLNEKILSRRKLRAALTSQEVQFIVEEMGPKYLRRKYPSKTLYVSKALAA